MHLPLKEIYLCQSQIFPRAAVQLPRTRLYKFIFCYPYSEIQRSDDRQPRHPVGSLNSTSPSENGRSSEKPRVAARAKSTSIEKIMSKKVVHILKISLYSKQGKKCILCRGQPTSALFSRRGLLRSSRFPIREPIALIVADFEQSL